jgi:glycosyltransferase involved in cell wall biosynthesis
LCPGDKALLIRVLFLIRQPSPDLAIHVQTLAEALGDSDVEAVVDDVSGWMPSKTGWMTDRKVSRDLKRAAQGFDMVHAFGYRTAWACSEAFYVRFPWVYTAFDMPKTRHPHLIDRLNAARRGLCSSRAVRDSLREAEAMNLEVLSPCVPDTPVLDRKESLKEGLGVPVDDSLIFWSGGVEPKDGLDILLRAAPEILPFVPSARFVIAPWDQLTPDQEAMVKAAPDRIRVIQEPGLWLRASDLAVVCRQGAGFSMIAAQAMMEGVPVLLRRDAGLAEMAGDGDSGFFYDEDSELGTKLRLLLESPMTLEAVGRGGQVRAQDRYDASTAARVLARTYREILDR